MPIPNTNPSLVRALQRDAGFSCSCIVKIRGAHNVRRYRAAVRYIKAINLVRLTGGAAGANAAHDARFDFDRLEMSNAEAVGGPVRIPDRSRFAGDDE